MSVVNRMLQDIDRRRTMAGVAANHNMDIHSVSFAPVPAVGIMPISAKYRATLIAAVLMVACAAVVWHAWRGRAESSADYAPVAIKVPAVPTRTPVAAPALPEISASPANFSAVLNEPESSISAIAVTDEKMAAKPALTDSAESRTNAETLKLSLQLSALVTAAPLPNVPAKIAPAVKRPIAPVRLSTAPDSTLTITQANAPVRQVAAEETIRAAGNLWGDGARSAALETLREALALAEVAHNNRATAPLARELARLEVADNRARVALDLLKRLENLSRDDADTWALRGNTEQRLGLHTEAAESYLVALRLRTTEGRWMIGAAISLAASGKQDEARMWVERARERGAVTPTISVYLQQLGIAAR